MYSILALMAKYKKIFLIPFLFFGSWFLLVNLSIAEDLTPTITDIQTKNIGEGTFLDVAFYNSKVWLAIQQGANTLNLYSTSSNFSNLKTEKTFTFGVVEGEAFPRLTNYNNNLWLVYRDNKDNQAKLWNLKTGSTEILGSGQTGGADPVAFGNGFVAWQKADANFSIMVRRIDGSKGSEQNVGPGRPTGLSRILEDGSVVLVDDDRDILSNGTRPSFAGSLAVVEGQDGGAIIVNTEDDTVLSTLFDGQISFTPRIATDDKGNYVVATWGSGGTGVRLATFKGPVSSETSETEPNPTTPGKPFTSTSPIYAPTEGLPTDLGDLIQKIFGWSLSVLGIAVFVMVFYAGFLWLTAAGNTSRIGEARSRITNAVFGAVLLLSSYLILYTINPDFVKCTFNLPGLGETTKDDDVACEEEEVPIPADSLLADLQAERAKYGDLLTHDEVGELLNAVAWKNKDAGWGLLSKSSGNNCNQKPGGPKISCDYLVHKPSGLGSDFLIGAPGTKDDGTLVSGPSTPTWGDACPPNPPEPERWLAPIEP